MGTLQRPGCACLLPDSSAGGCRGPVAKPGSPAAPGQGEYVRHPDFPNLPASTPDVYVRTVHACLCHHPEDRPQFSQVEAVLAALGDTGKIAVRTPSQPPLPLSAASPAPLLLLCVLCGPDSKHCMCDWRRGCEQLLWLPCVTVCFGAVPCNASISNIVYNRDCAV